MESENRKNPRPFLTPAVANHLILLAVVLLFAGGLYLYLGNPTTLVAGGVILLLAHAAMATGVLLLARGWIKKAFRWLMGSSTTKNQR